jgi:phosphoesterase RecJ-like protein
MMTTSATQWDEAARAIRDAQRILIVTHVRPDGDAVGSMLGLMLYLESLGKSVHAAVDGGMPDFLAFLPGSERVSSSVKTGDFDVMIAVDASDAERTGNCGAYGFAHSKAVLNIDHHRTNTEFGQIHLIMPSAVSTTEVLYHWFTTMKVNITPEMAAALLTGLVTDTMGFRTNHTRASTLAVAQVLIAEGASLHDIMERTLNTQKFYVVELWKRALATVRLQFGVISAAITLADLREMNLPEVPDTGLVTWLASVEEAYIAVLFKENSDHTVTISIRSKVGVDISGVALALGGGGHSQASGATLDGSLETVIPAVLERLHEVVFRVVPALKPH